MANVKTLHINGVDIESKLYMGGCTASGTSNTSFAIGNNTMNPITLTQMTELDGNAVALTEDGGIKILKTGIYLINASIYVGIDGPTTTSNKLYYGIYIKTGNSKEDVQENGSTHELVSVYLPYWGEGGVAAVSAATGSRLVLLNENTNLYLCGRLGGGATGTIYSGNPSTYITVLRMGLDPQDDANGEGEG